LVATAINRLAIAARRTISDGETRRAVPTQFETVVKKVTTFRVFSSVKCSTFSEKRFTIAGKTLHFSNLPFHRLDIRLAFQWPKAIATHGVEFLQSRANKRTADIFAGKNDASLPTLQLCTLEPSSPTFFP